MICQYCDKPLEGRSNRRYHDECKRSHGRDSRQLKVLLSRIVENEKVENEALRAGIYEYVRHARARQYRDKIEVTILGDRLKLFSVPIYQFVDWLRKKRPRSFSEQAAWENYCRNRSR